MRKRRLLLFFMIVSLFVWPVDAKEDVIRWVDFDVSCEAMERAVELAAQARERDEPVTWLQLLALAGVYGGGHVHTAQVTRAAEGFRTAQPVTPEQEKLYAYYLEAYTAALGGLVDRGIARFATGEIELNDETYAAWLSELKAAGSDELVAMYAEN